MTPDLIAILLPLVERIAGALTEQAARDLLAAALYMQCGCTVETAFDAADAFMAERSRRHKEPPCCL